MKNIKLPTNVKSAIDILNADGFTAYLVGGCVRDSLMGLIPKDFDITTSAMPNEIKAAFKGYRTADTGIKHGTVTVIIDDMPLEITTFRNDGEYMDHRHPVEVTFSDNIHSDLKRRDFTVNSLAYHPKIGIIDDFGGVKDIENRIIRCVGEPKKRFDEDALRILRGIRFASVLGFTIESKTENAMCELCESLKYIAAERINSEFKKLLLGMGYYKIIDRYKKIIFTFIPELRLIENCPQNNPYHIYDVWNHTVEALKNTPPIVTVRMAVLLHDIGKGKSKTTDQNGCDHFYGHRTISAELAETILNNLRFSAAETKEICTLIAYHDEPLPITEKRMKRLLRKIGEDSIKNLLYVKYADIMGKNKDIAEKLIGLVDDAGKTLELAKVQCFSLKNLNINGNDLLLIGFKPGREMGNMLSTLLDMVIENKIPNDRKLLMDIAEKALSAMYSQDQS